jgi:acetoin utilization deacetylase AcuC-like enzyme
MKIYANDRHALPLPPGHRFPSAKYRLLRERVRQMWPDWSIEEAEPASEGELALAHDPPYIQSVLDGTLSDEAQREIGFPWSPAMVQRACRSVGATVAAARAALCDGVAVHLAGGTHHANRDRGSGYCVFNDVAVAARLMQAEVHRRERRLLRVWVIDLDVHQGNGTAEIFRDDPTVYTLSLHGARNFPARKVAGDVDVDLPDGCGDADYLQALDGALALGWSRQREAGAPGLAFYLAGADPHEGDRLGRLKLSAAGLAERDRRVLAALGRWRVPVALTMAGGYGHDIDVTVALQLETVRLAWQAWRHWHAGDRPTPAGAEQSAA